MWVDASSLATRVINENSGSIAEDAWWLRPVNKNRHINLAELGTVSRGVNLVLQRKARVTHLQTDSACMHCWITDSLFKKKSVRTKAVSEMLIRRQLTTL